MSPIHLSRIRIWATFLVLGCTAGGLSACDPCFGISTCSDSGVIDYEGTIVNDAGGAAPGVQLLITRQAGIELKQDTLRAITGSDGHFFIHGEAESPGTLQARVDVIPTDRPSFHADSVVLQATTSGGTQFFGRWTMNPFVSYLVSLRYRTNGKPVAQATVDFHRTGSERADPDYRRVVTNDDGYFWIIANVHGNEPLTGRLSIRPQGSDVVLTVPEIRLRLLYAIGESHFLVQWVGPSVAYKGRLVWADTGEPAADVDVEFTRTSGLAVSADSFTVKTDSAGLFPLHIHLSDPVHAGEVVGRLRVNAPTPYQPLTTEVRLRTFEADTFRLLGEWALQRAP